MMQKKKMIIDIIGKEIEKYGFTYGLEKAYSAPNLWGFTREVNGIKQRIIIQQHRFMPALFLEFSTSAWGGNMGERAGTKIKIPPNYSNNHDTWSYNDDEKFKKILLEFVDIIEKYGLKNLEERSVEPEVIPTNEMGEKLISSVEELSCKFIQDNQIKNLEMNEENILKWFKLVENKFEQTKDLPYDDVKDMLVEVVAFLGEQLRKKLNGEWRAGLDPRVVPLVRLEVEPNRQGSYNLLTTMVEAWGEKDLSRVKERYLAFLKNR